MRANKFITRCLLGIVLLGAQSIANAALLGTCTFTGGCGPDFFIPITHGVGGGVISYDWDDVSTGTLTLSGSVDNASFLDGQLGSPWPSNEINTPDLNPDAAIPVSAGIAGNSFSLTLTVDGSGSLISGSLGMNGKVSTFWGPLNTNDPDFFTGGIYGPGFYTANTMNGTALDGTLIAAGSTITALGSNATAIDFRFDLGAGSLLADYGLSGAGLATFSGISTGSIDWSQDWSATSVNLDVVVPLPAAFWLFLSGMAALVSVSKTRLNNCG